MSAINGMIVTLLAQVVDRKLTEQDKRARISPDYDQGNLDGMLVALDCVVLKICQAPADDSTAPGFLAVIEILKNLKDAIKDDAPIAPEPKLPEDAA